MLSDARRSDYTKHPSGALTGIGRLSSVIVNNASFNAPILSLRCCCRSIIRSTMGGEAVESAGGVM